MSRCICGCHLKDGPIMVTGAAGFVGQRLLRMFRMGSGDMACDSTLEFSAPKGVRKFVWNLPGQPSVFPGTPAYIVHLAGLSSVALSHKGPDRVMEVNAHGTETVARWAAANSPEARILFAGSAEVYQRSDSPLFEGSPLEPVSPYGRSKLEAEKLLAGAYDDFVVARAFPHFGPGQAGHFVLSSFCRRIIEAIAHGEESMVTGNLNAIRDYLYIDDVVSAYAFLLAKGSPGGAYNVCSGNGRSIGELLDILLTQAGARLEPLTDPELLRSGDQSCQVGNPDKLRSLGWRPEVSLEDGLAVLYKWWEERL